jgi:hypothetical protein
LKDVFDYSLEEIAELVDSTVGGVKAALNRARTKLAASSPPTKSARSASPELKRLMQLYAMPGSTLPKGLLGNLWMRRISTITSAGLFLGNWRWVKWTVNRR